MDGRSTREVEMAKISNKRRNEGRKDIERKKAKPSPDAGTSGGAHDTKNK